MGRTEPLQDGLGPVDFCFSLIQGQALELVPSCVQEPRELRALCVQVFEGFGSLTLAQA